MEMQSSAEQSRDADVVDRGVGSTKVFPRRRSSSSSLGSRCGGVLLLLSSLSLPLFFSSVLAASGGGLGKRALGFRVCGGRGVL